MARAAVLLSGPPGVGKTSSALIICRELGYEPIEVSGFKRSADREPRCGWTDWFCALCFES